jgi:A/G-specific adenine glycosylase
VVPREPTAGDGHGDLRAALLAWYEPRRSMYPWRREPDPYRTLVSEVMLQQTQAARVAPAFERFVARFPDVTALAEATRADVLRAWDGLGYNRRAVALSEAARAMVREHGGGVPADTVALRALPGVGPYTAAAVAAIAHGASVAAVDVNVRRVIGRAVLGADPSSPTMGEVDRAAEDLVDRADPAGWNQAVMDLGREVCRPTPRCAACPIEPWCAWRRASGAEAGEIVQERVAVRRRQGRFEGSFRQIRGGVIRALRDGPATVEELAVTIRRGSDSVSRAVVALESEGAVERAPDGTIRLAESELGNAIAER